VSSALREAEPLPRGGLLVTTLAEATVRFGTSGHAVKRELERIMLARAARGVDTPVFGPSGHLDPEVEGELAARLGERPTAGHYSSG
jgi:hypothetical protein